MSNAVITPSKVADLFMDVLAATTVCSWNQGAPTDTDEHVATASPDVPRNVSTSVWNTSGGPLDIEETTCIVVGIDAKGNLITETVTMPATLAVPNNTGVTAYSSRAFAIVSTIQFNVAQANTAHRVGISNKLGLSNKIYSTSDVYKIKKNNANAVVAGAQVDATYDTYDMSVIGLAATDDFTIWYKTRLG